MAQPASEQHPVGGSAASCPIACGILRLVTWAVARVPQAVRAAILVVIAFAAAAVYNAANPLGLPWGPSPGNRVGLPRAFESRLPEIDAAQAFSLYEAGEVLFVDSRDAKDYDRDHVPGALNFPMREWVTLWPRMRSVLPKDRTLVLYCYGAHCGLSTRQGKALLEQGYDKLLVLDYGWTTWTGHGYPTVRHPAGGKGT